MSYEYLNHRADVGLCVTAASLEEVFGDAAEALFALMYDPTRIAWTTTLPVQVSSSDRATLVVDFMNELRSLMDRKDMFFAFCDSITLSDDGATYVVHAMVHGEGQDVKRHAVRTDVKAATYSGLVLTEAHGTYTFQCLIDL